MNEEEKKKLFISLVTEEGLEKMLGEMVHREEFIMNIDGGEPDLVHLLCIRLLEALRGDRELYSMVYDEEWREHALKKEVKR